MLDASGGSCKSEDLICKYLDGGSGTSVPNTFYGGLSSVCMARNDITYEFKYADTNETAPITGSYITACSIDSNEGISYLSESSYETTTLSQTLIETPLNGIFYCPTVSTSDLIGSSDFPKWAGSFKVNENNPTFRVFNLKDGSKSSGNWNPPMLMPLTLYAPLSPNKSVSIQ